MMKEWRKVGGGDIWGRWKRTLGEVWGKSRVKVRKNKKGKGQRNEGKKEWKEYIKSEINAEGRKNGEERRGRRAGGRRGRTVEPTCCSWLHPSLGTPREGLAGSLLPLLFWSFSPRTLLPGLSPFHRVPFRWSTIWSAHNWQRKGLRACPTQILSIEKAMCCPSAQGTEDTR